MGHPRPLFVFFCLFKQIIQVLQEIHVKKCPSSKQCWDLNPQPSDNESPLTTTTLVNFTRHNFEKITVNSAATYSTNSQPHFH